MHVEASRQPPGRCPLADRRDIWIVLGPGVLALVLRLYDLIGESLWFDEAYSVWTSAMDIASLRLLWDWQVEFPLYYLLLHYWMRLFGQGEFAVRAFGALAGTLTIVPIYLWGKALFGRRAGFLGALLLAVNPYHVWYSQEVRMFPWAVLFVVASLLAFWRLMHGGGWGWWVGHTVLTGLTFHLHYYVGWIVLVENCFYLGWLWHRKGNILARQAWPQLRSWLLDQLGVCILTLPAFAVFWTKLVTFDQWGWLAQRYGPPRLSDVVGLFFAYTVGLAFPGPSVLRWLVLALVAILVGWNILRLVRAGDKMSERREALLLTLLALGLPLMLVFALGQFASIWVPRHLILFMPAFLLLVALGMDALGTRGRVGATVLLLATSFYALSGMYGVQQKEDWRGVAAYLSVHAAPDDLIVLMDEECRVPLGYYAQRTADVEVSRFADDAMLNEAVAEILGAPRGERLWLVVSHADSHGLERRLNTLSELGPVRTPDFVGIKLVGYEWS